MQQTLYMDHTLYGSHDKLIQDIYTDRTIVPIPAFYQAVGGGGPGCITQQLPKNINTNI